MSIDEKLLNYQTKMETSVNLFIKELGAIRTGRANPSILENVKTEVYGKLTPINQVANISVLDPRTLLVNVWDKSIIQNVSDAIRDCGMNFNPQVEGTSIKVPLVPLTQERRNELCKVAAKNAENTKISLRNIRHDALDKIKQMEKQKEITEDIKKKLSNEIQDLLKKFTDKIDQKLKEKQDAILEI